MTDVYQASGGSGAIVHRKSKSRKNKKAKDEDLYKPQYHEHSTLDQLKRAEVTVDAYMSKLKELDGEGHASDNANVQPENDDILSKVHKTYTHNRHIYFGGIPLDHSLHVLKHLKQERKLKDRIEQLNGEIELLTQHNEELLTSQKNNFYKFELALGKAMRLGMGCQALATATLEIRRNRLREFLVSLRNEWLDHVLRKVHHLTKKGKRNYNIAALVIVDKFHKLLVDSLAEPFKLLKNRTTGGYIEPIEFKRRLEELKIQEEQILGINKLPTTEESLLCRLETLVLQEMKMLNSARKYDI